MCIVTGGMKQTMKTKLLNKIICLTMCFLILLANMYALKCLSLLKQYADRIFICYPKDSVSDSALDRLQENDKGESFSAAALWKSAEEVTVSEENTGRMQKARLYQIKGQPAAVFGNGCAGGRYFTEEEQKVCMLDQCLARELFGSENVLGMEVKVNGKNCQITGILKGSLSVCIVPAEENTGFDGAAVRKQKAAQSSALAVSLTEAVLGSTDGQIVDGQLYFMTAVLFYTLALAFMLLAAGFTAARAVATRTTAARITGTNTAAACITGTNITAARITDTNTAAVRIAAAGRGKFLSGCVLGVCITASIGVIISGIRTAAPGADYLPTYWSDLDFFSRIFREKAAEIQSLSAHQEFFAWQEMFHAWVQAAGAGIFAGMTAGVLAAYNGCSRGKNL